MELISRLSLRTMLVVPYVVLILLLALVNGWLSHDSGRDAIDTWSSQLLVETVERIKQAVDQHVSGSAAVLEAAFPKGVPSPATLEDDLQATDTATSYAGQTGQTGQRPPARTTTASRPHGTDEPDFSKMTQAEKVQWNLDRWKRILD